MRGKAAFVIAGFFALFLAVLANQRSAEWETPLSLWSAAVEDGPDMPRSHLWKGLALKDNANWQLALAHFRQSAKKAALADDLTLLLKALNNAGAVHYEIDDLEPAEDFFQQVLSWDVNHVDATVNLGSVRFKQAQKTRDPSLLREAQALYERALALDPGNDIAFQNLKLVGRILEALE